jgi:sulfite reductase alpha subunit-like flavoprotein
MLQVLNQVKAAQQEAMSAGAQAFSTLVESATKYSELSVAAAKDGFADVAAAVKTTEGWTPEVGFVNPAEKMAPVASKAIKYSKTSLQLAQETADSLADTSYAAVKTMAKRADAITDELAGMLPAQSEPMLKNMKAALAQNLAWYEQAFGVAGQMQKQFFATSEQWMNSVAKETASPSIVSIVPKRKRA